MFLFFSNGVGVVGSLVITILASIILLYSCST